MTLAQAEVDGGRRGDIELMLVAYDRDGKPLNFVVANGQI
jgi:hypothetical protein